MAVGGGWKLKRRGAAWIDIYYCDAKRRNDDEACYNMRHEAREDLFAPVKKM